MKNVKDQVFAALSAVFDNVSDQYPGNFMDSPAIQFMEEDNKVYEHTFSGHMPKEDKSYIRYRVDIWDKKSTSESMLKVDKALSALGLARILCQDAPDPSEWKHKVMRYEAIIDMDSDAVYWP